MKTMNFLLMALIFSVTVPIHASRTGKVYSVHLGQYPSNEQAQDAVTAYKGQGFEPVFVRAEGSESYLVLWGNFVSFAEARVYHIFCKNDLPSDSVVISSDWVGETLIAPQMPTTLPVPTGALSGSLTEVIYQTDYDPSPGIPANVLPILSVTDISSLTAEQIYQQGSYTTNRDEAIAILEHGIEKYGSSDWGNKLRLRVARKYLAKKDYAKVDELITLVKSVGTSEDDAMAGWVRAYALNSQKKPDEALSAFIDCCNDSALPAKERLDAAMRIAALHHAQRHQQASYVAFRQIRDAAVPNNVKTFCDMQMMGLEMELARSDKGELLECISYASDILARYPNGSPKVLATARLMALECDYYLGNYTSSIQSANSLILDYPSELRESYTGLYWAGLASSKLGDLDGAIAYFKRIHEKNLAKSNVFPGMDIRALSLREMGRAYSAKGSSALGEHYYQLQSELYPEN